MKKLLLIVAITVMAPAVFAEDSSVKDAVDTKSSINADINTKSVDMNADNSNSATNGDTGPGLNSGSGLSAEPSMGAGSKVGSSGR